MIELPDIRFVLMSDFATMDQSGKFVIGGMYTEDMIVPELPTVVPILVFTVFARSPSKEIDLTMRIRAPSGAIVVGGDVILSPSPPQQGTDGRSIMGFQFNGLKLSEAGQYRMTLSLRSDPGNEIEIHDFRVAVGQIPEHLVAEDLKLSGSPDSA